MEIQQKHLIQPNFIGKNEHSFIEANTRKVTLEHLRDDCNIPVFSKDNETTISHYQFINKTMEVAQLLFPDQKIREPEIRVSHIIKGRTPDAIGVPVKELKEHQKTIYYERCGFIINIPQVTEIVNGNKLSLSIGGVRAYNQENLYSKKSLEKFKVFIGFKNLVCCNLCISTDGIANDIKIGSILDLEEKLYSLSLQWNKEKQLGNLELMSKYNLTERQFAHLIGKMRMYQHLSSDTQKELLTIEMNDSQINSVVKSYFKDSNFCCAKNGEINLYNFYNLLTGANKSSYIDKFLNRSVFAYEFTNNLCNSLEHNSANWFLYY